MSQMSNTVELGGIMSKNPISQTFTSVQRIVGVCFLTIFVVTLSLVIVSSLGVSVENSNYWFDLFKVITGGIIGYFLGANMRKQTTNSESDSSE